MFLSSNNFRSVWAVLGAAAGLLLAAGSARAAGLVGYRNETNMPVVVQSVVVSNGKTTLSKPQKLYPGEVALDSLAFTGTRKIVVYDAKTPDVKLFQGDVNSTEDVFFAIRPKEMTVKVKGQPPPPPEVELVKTRRLAFGSCISAAAPHSAP
jgi:hypothetical protein